MPSPLGEGQTDMPINRDHLGEVQTDTPINRLHLDEVLPARDHFSSSDLDFSHHQDE